MRMTARIFTNALCALYLGMGLCAAPGASAQTQRSPHQAEAFQAGSSRAINLAVGRSIIIDLPRDAAEIFVGDPKVVSAVVRSARKLYLIASAKGQTSLYATDAKGERIAEMQVSVGRDIAELERILLAAMPKSEIVVKTVENTIIMSGFADSAGEAQMAYDIAVGFLGQSDKGDTLGKVVNSITLRGRDQVMLKVTIAEVQRTVLKQLGVTNAIASGGWGAWSMQNALTANLSQLTEGKLTLGAYDAIKGGASASGLAGLIQAYERNGVAKILAEPTVTAMSGEAAKFTAGGEIPVPSSYSCSAGICTTGITFKPYGVGLNFTPVVLGEGRIQLRIGTEVTEVDPTATITIGPVTVPGFRTRKNETTVELPSGGSIVTAGLIQTKSKQIINGLPGLMNLPILGALFRSRDYQREETELMIIVTPYLARSVRPQDVARPTDGLSDATDPQGFMLGRVNKLYATTDNPQVIKNFKGKVGFIAD